MLPPVIDEKTPLGLGSASPRRKALLETLGIPLVVMTAEVDERRRGGEAPAFYLERVTRDKLEAVAAHDAARATSVLLVADTIVLLGDDILGKPTNDEDAVAMLTRLSGQAHEVRTRFLLGKAVEKRSDAAAAASGSRSDRASLVYAETVSTVVHFRPLENDEIRRYVATGEGRDKAGAYAVQGIGSFAVRRIEGSYSNVVGLPVCEVVLALRRFGFLAAFP
jgi:septum formation protein